MAWTTPRTWATSELVTGSMLNTHVRDNFLAVLHPFALSGAQVDVVNTTTETSLGSFNVPGNSLGANGTLIALYEGDFLWNASNTHTINLRIKFGGTTHIQGAFIPYNSTLLTARMYWALEISLTNLNSTGAQFLVAQWLRPTSTGISGSTSLGTWVGTANVASHALPTIDTTADRTFEVTAQWSSASSNNSFRRYLMHGMVAKV